MNQPRFPGFYPITQFYLVAVAVVVAAVNDWLTVTQAIIILGFTCIIMLAVMLWREARTIHKLVDGQRADMINRIDKLASLLTANGITPPASGEKEREARREVAAEKSAGTFPGGTS